MVNSFKGKASKGSIGLMCEKGRLKVNFPRQYFPKQERKGLQLEDNPGNRIKAGSIIKDLQHELEKGKLHTENGNFNQIRFDEILSEHGVITLKSIQGGKSKISSDISLQTQLGLLDVWNKYCEYIKPNMRETHYEAVYLGKYHHFLNDAINACKSEDAVKIRNWLLENRSFNHVKTLLSKLSDCYTLAIKQGTASSNPWDGMSREMKHKGATGKTKNEIDIESDEDVLDKSKAYRWEETQIILDYCKNHKPLWLLNFLKFKFLTGCRTGEAIGFMWCDVLWDREQILIRRTYSRYSKKFYPLKNAKGSELIRIFPLPKNGELWSLLKSIPQENNNEVVFKTKFGKIIIAENAGQHWRGESISKLKGIIPTLIEQGKLSKYLSPYNTRHTFITHQVFDLGRDEKIVSAWCGHNERVSEKHYQDISDRANQINPELPANQTQLDSQKSELELLKEQLLQQQELINKLLKDKQ